MGMLTRAAILEAARNAKIERDQLSVPELGGEIWVRGMSGVERDRLEESFRIKNGAKRGQVDLRNFRAMRVCRVVVDEAGQRLLNDHDVDVIGQLPSGCLDRIIARSEELSGRDPDEVADLKNGSESEAGGGASSSTSPSGGIGPV